MNKEDPGKIAREQKKYTRIGRVPGKKLMGMRRN